MRLAIHTAAAPHIGIPSRRHSADTCNTLQFTKGKKHTSITKKSGKVERKLMDSIQYTIEHSSHIPEAVSFKIPIHGIWREWAVGYGQPRVSGKCLNPHPRIRRSMVDWQDEPIDRNAKRFFDFAAELWGTGACHGYAGQRGDEC